MLPFREDKTDATGEGAPSRNKTEPLTHCFPLKSFYCFNMDTIICQEGSTVNWFRSPLGAKSHPCFFKISPASCF